MSEWGDYITGRNKSNICSNYVITSRGCGKSIFGELGKDLEEKSNMNKRNDYIDALKYAYAYDRPRPLTIKKVIFNPPATIVFWSDKTKTVVECSEEENGFDEEKGLAMAILKKLCEEKGLTNLDIGEFSDGFHTFNSLYHQRLILFAALVNTYPDISWKTKRHSDGEECFGGGWFLVGIDTPEGPYTYHYELKDWDLFNCKELDRGPEWDGHTDKDVGRLLSLSKEGE